MAQRRMFSLKIIGSDAFLEMPTSSRELYFQLGMYSDDDGFINPKKVMRMVGSSEDDLKMLVVKRFVLPFENGVIVIKHWKINNLIRKDIYEETMYVDQKKTLFLKKNGSYTDNPENGKPVKVFTLTKRQRDVNEKLPQVRIGKDRLDKVSIDKNKEEKEEVAIAPSDNSSLNEINQIFELFYKTINPAINFGNKSQRKACERLIKQFSFDKVKNAVQYAISIQNQKYGPTITTPIQLENKWGDLIAFKLKENNNDKKIISI